LADDRQTSDDDLARRIQDAKAAHDRGISNAEGRAESRGWAVGVEFVGAVLVSAFIGWLIDRFAGTAPWAMIILLVLGFAAGTRRAMRTSAQFDSDPASDKRK
jgi:ATP synthase protein I